MSGLKEIKNKIASFKRRYYLRQIAFGIICFFILNLMVFFMLSVLEHQFWLSVLHRSILFYGFLILLIVSSYILILRPVLLALKLRKGLTDEQAATEIVNYFPEIEDKLINTLQLGSQPGGTLLEAAIEKKSVEVKKFVFIRAVNFQSVKKYGLALFCITIALILVSFVNPSLITDSPKRIINFKKEFISNAPFLFSVKNQEFIAFRGEDFTLNIDMEGDQIPEYAHLFVDNVNIKRIKIKRNQFSHVFHNLQSKKEIYFESAGFQSKRYTVEVHDRPNLISMLIRVTEPNYVGGQRRTIENTGDLIVLEGSKVSWEINTLATDSAHLIFNEEKKNFGRIDEDESILTVNQQIMNDGNYRIALFNSFSQNKSTLSYSIDVIKDQYPEITTQYFLDSTTYQSISMVGLISDDYGFSTLHLNYRKENQKNYTKIPLDIDKNLIPQRYYARWNLDTLNLPPGQLLEVHMSVRDNDKIHGAKETKSSSFILKIPDLNEIDSLMYKKESDVANQLNSNKEKSEKIASKLKAFEERLKSEQKFNWQEKRILNEIIEDREKLNKEIQKLKKKHEDLLESNKQLNRHSDQLQDKNKKLQELINQLMDEETRELYEKLKKLLEQDTHLDEIRQQVNKLSKKEQNRERDLERTLELFKRLKIESSLERNLQKLDTLSSKQEKASEKVAHKNTQEKIKQEFEDFREKMNDVQKLNQELKKPIVIESFELEIRQIDKELREIIDKMKDQQDSPSDSKDQKQEARQQKHPPPSIQQKQKKAAEKMKQLGKKLSNMKEGMQMKMIQANLDQLRNILDNLIKISFNQEELIVEMRKVNQSDPRFIKLSQNQLKLKDDVKVVQDSLLSLASKVVQISSFVTREVESINKNLNQATNYLKKRQRGHALSSQQFTMTSLNNLALLLDDTMQQMQMTLSEAMGTSKPDQKRKNQGIPDFYEQQMKLSDKINELKTSGKTGRELSEKLAKLAAAQEKIRQQMEQIKEAQDGKPEGKFGNSKLQNAIDMMKQNEIDLVNKRLTQRLIARQKQITTRMLEAEKAQKSQEEDEQRKAQKPSIISRKMPPEFKNYLNLRKKESELLKTIPPELNQFYKKEVNDYYRRLSTTKRE